jgi:hypothetical protein
MRLSVDSPDAASVQEVPPNFRKGAKPTLHQRRRHRAVLSMLRQVTGNVLDYGCGFGNAREERLHDPRFNLLL